MHLSAVMPDATNIYVIRHAVYQFTRAECLVGNIPSHITHTVTMHPVQYRCEHDRFVIYACFYKIHIHMYSALPVYGERILYDTPFRKSR